MGEHKYNVIVSDRARKMLGTHMRFMAQVDKAAAAVKKKELIAAMRSLEYMPQRFPFFEEPYIPPNKYHKMFVQKWYLVLYQIKDDIKDYHVQKESFLNWKIDVSFLNKIYEEYVLKVENLFNLLKISKQDELYQYLKNMF